VPQKHKEYVALWNWVNKQRGRHTNNILRFDRKELLDEIGFAWKATSAAGNYNKKKHDEYWHQQYEKLVEFKRKNGNCHVPQGYEKDVSLGNWVKTQRQIHSRNNLQLDRKELLDEIGFAWKFRGTGTGNYKRKTWHLQYEKLAEFKRKNGHCVVPQKYQEDVFFGKWVSYQRQMHAKNKLRLDRKELLDEIGFAWEVPRGGNTESRQRQFHANNKIPIYRKELLDELGSAWKADTVAARSSTTDVSRR
jgi:hypothetical protein